MRMDRFLQACELGQAAEVREFLLLLRFQNQNVSEVLNAAYPHRDDRYSPLVLASANGHVTVVNLLIQFGADATYRSPAGRTRKGTTPLHEAAEGGHSTVIQALLQANPRGGGGGRCRGRGNPNQAVGYVQVTPLFVAASHGHAEAVRVLLQAGAVNYQKREKFSIDTPLLVACSCGHEDVVRVLLHNSIANINDADCAGRTPLFLAVHVGHPRILRLLLRHGADVDRTEGHFSNSALHEAVKRERPDLVHELLAASARLLENHLAETPLCIAIEKSNEAIVRAIVQERRCEVLDRYYRHGQRSKRPLHYACSLVCVSFDIVRLLVELGADVDQRDPHHAGETPLLICARCRSGCARRCKVRVAEYLVRERRASPHLTDNFGRSPLHRAAQSGCDSMVRLFLSMGASIDQPDMYGATPLHFAVRGFSSTRGNATAVAILVEHSAALDKQENGGTTPLHIASRNGDTEMVNILLLRHANTNITNEEGKTPLHVAVELGHVEVVRLLVQHSSCIDQTDMYGWTPLDVASAGGDANIVRILMEVHVAGERGSLEHVKRLLLHGTT